MTLAALDTTSEPLAAFFRPVAPRSELSLYLPSFQSPVATAPTNPPLKYPGATFSDRDARAAVAVSALAARVFAPAAIEIRHTDDFANGPAPHAGVVFGSRSSSVTPLLFEEFNAGRFFSFSFGPLWTIRWRDGTEYSIPDPSKLRSDDYIRHADYAVLARLTSRKGGAIFLLAGLGSRATEGCGYFLTSAWQQLLQAHGTDDFALVLEFQPPIDPHSARVVRETTDG